MRPVLRRLLLVAALPLALACVWKKPIATQVSDLDTDIDKKLPPGSSRAQVEEFLRSKHAHPDYIPERNLVFGKISNARRSLLVGTDIAIFFDLSSNGTLAGHRIETWVTGP